MGLGVAGTSVTHGSFLLLRCRPEARVAPWASGVSVQLGLALSGHPGDSGIDLTQAFPWGLRPPLPPVKSMAAQSGQAVLCCRMLACPLWGRRGS